MPRVRVMKARASRAVSCGHWVIRGEMIVLVPGGGWVCLACRLAEVRRLRARANALKIEQVLEECEDMDGIGD